MNRLEELSLKRLCLQLNALEVFSQQSNEVNYEAIAAWQRVRRVPEYHLHWMRESLRLLRRFDLLIEHAGGALELLVKPSDEKKVKSEWDQMKAQVQADRDLIAHVKLLDAVLHELPAILTGDKPATAALFPKSSTELVEGIYRDNTVADRFNEEVASKLASYVQARRLKDPETRIRILEVGAGTGGTSASVFAHLSPHERSIAEYCYSDISMAFLAHGKQTFGTKAPYVRYQLFNLEKTLASQGIETGVYDAVIASNVLHATTDIRQTLRKVKATLKKHGCLFLNEITAHSVFAHMTFGLLEGWWSHRDVALRIPGTPVLAPHTWRRVLEAEGFRSVIVHPADMPEAGQHVMIAESDGVIRQTLSTHVDPADDGIAERMQEKSRLETSQAQHVESQPVIRKAHQAMSNMSGTRDASVVLRGVRTIVREVIKLEEDRFGDDDKFSEYGVDSIIAVEFIKRINEYFVIRLATTAIFDYPTVNELARHIVEKCGVLGHPAAPSEAPQPRSGSPRAAEVNRAKSSARRRSSAVSARYHVSEQSEACAVASSRHSSATLTYKRVVINGPGGVDDVEICAAKAPQLGVHEVQIAVHAFSLNFADVLCIAGLYPNMPPYPFTPGSEICGKVVAVGAAVSGIREGDSVVAIMDEKLGGHASLVTCDASQAFLLPEGLSAEQACALPVVAITMIAAFRKADVKRGERILIQTAAGGTGLVAVQLARHLGAEIYATAGSKRKLDYLQSIGVPYGINYKECDFEKEIHRLTKGRGVDVIINTLSGDAIQKGFRCLAAGGRYVEIAMTALSVARTIDLSQLNDNQTFYSLDIGKVGLSDRQAFEQYRSEMIELVRRGVITPTVSKVFPFNQVKEAYRQLQGGRNIGKVVVSIPYELRFRMHRVVSGGPQVVAGPRVLEHAESVAIVGMAGRFAGSDNVDDLWRHLTEGTDLTKAVPRWDRVGSADDGGVIRSDRRGGFLRKIDQFDPMFFKIAGVEANYMDPQQRLLLEEAWTALEDAGYGGESIEGRRCGVYVGCATGDYGQLFKGEVPSQAFWGNAASVVPARVSYYLNLRGPAIAVDTACSSSLVAIHLACQGLRAGEISMAIAGGVHVQCTSALYESMNRAGMLSSTGQCHTFDEEADGFVPGEGAGVVVLKRLSDALADGDHVYGVIVGSGVNQDGATNGITAPSALSQERLECDVYDASRTAVEDIQMVEAHGTGTRLGDPIEYQALTNAFRRYTDKRQYCAIGSIKTNIGHTGPAAGVAGIIKVLLSLKHQKIPASLHFKRGNSYIDFESSPFYVNAHLRDWNVDHGKRRCAAISSFGMSGTNAHVVIESAPAVARVCSARPAYLIALSAHTQEQLVTQATRLARHCIDNPEISCGDISYTLLVGRRHFEHRLVALVRDREELVGKLERWVAGDRDIASIYCSVVPHRTDCQTDVKLTRTEGLGESLGRRTKEEYLELLQSLSQAYMKGHRCSFDKLFDESECRRVSLPTYPFSRERHWVPQKEWASTSRDKELPSLGGLHPLLQRNTSVLKEQRFTSVFGGEEFYLSDHRVKESRVFPAVCYLEMAREALSRSVGEGGVAVVRLEDVVWLRPLVVDEEKEVHIGLQATEQGEIEFNVYSETGRERVVHAQGRGVLETQDVGGVARLDVEGLKSQCEERVEVERYYETFERMGLEYGAAHRGLTEVWIGRDAEGEQYVLAQIRLPPSVSETQDQYVLHPSVLDSALQAGIALQLNAEAEQRTSSLPFALRSVRILERTPALGWAYVKASRWEEAAQGRARKLDIQLCNEHGHVCVRLEGLTSRELEKSQNVKKTLVNETEGLTQPESELPMEFRGKVIHYLKELLGTTLQISPHRIEVEAELDRYGIDSLLAVKIVHKLEESIGNLPKTLMFECRSVQALAQYVIEHHRDAMLLHLKLKNRSRVPEEKEAATKDEQTAVERRCPIGWQTVEKASKEVVSQPGQADIGDVAIIGVSGRYPQAKDLRSYWDNLRTGKDCVTEIPASRWDFRKHFDPRKGTPGKSYSKWGGFIEGADEFDAQFFNISPVEARFMDPQERLFLQCVHHTLEDAGYTRDSLRSCLARPPEGNIGVFVGVMYEEYQLYGAQAQVLGEPYALGGSPSSIANRVSYFCNFHGPSIAVDTMCSSSLTAIHLACRSIRGGECEVAIAGGVNLSIHPNKYLMLSQMHFSSSTGRCESFGQGGDGYVPGEGVGAVLLKPLKLAIEQGDHIYAVIKGSSVNHGGRTNGFTVPNPQAQARVILNALRDARVDPRTISYIEAHGTGTSLGDPIEMAGLTLAFSQYTQERQYCAIGSAKSNIGHLESAAGIAGLTKVLLQMQHRELVPSLHSKVLNPYIEFAHTPFIVQRSLSDWRRPTINDNGEEKEHLRIAGVSSFGAGGANAHVIVEEYAGGVKPESTVEITTDRPALVVLSAKTTEALKEQVQQLLSYLQVSSGTEDLADIAFTLQVGREAMDHRLGVTAASVEELKQKLSQHLAGKGDRQDVHEGSLRQAVEVRSLFADDEDFEHTVSLWMRKGKHAKLLELWAKGVNVHWERLYGEKSAYGATPRRVSLPTYPFSRERHWVPQKEWASTSRDKELPSLGGLHPLLQRNTSVLKEQRFTSVFGGEEFYLSDHRVKESRVFPAVCYLEMAREALSRSVGEGGVAVVRLEDVVWLRPLVVDEEKEVHIGLQATEQGEIEFNVYSETGRERVVHAQGRGVLETQDVGGVARLDVEGLKSQCEERVEVERYYETFERMGLEYGAAHRGLTEVWIGRDAEGEQYVLAQIRLPPSVSETQDQYVLHPSVLDSALQAGIALQLNAEAEQRTSSLPFALRSVRILERTPALGWAYVKASRWEEAAQGRARKLDIQLCNEHGHVCAHIEGIESGTSELKVDRSPSLIYLQRHWTQVPTQRNTDCEAPGATRILLLDHTHRAAASAILVKWPQSTVKVLDSPSGDPEAIVCKLAVQVFQEVQFCLSGKPQHPLLLQLVIGDESVPPAWGHALCALFKSAQLENPKFRGQVIYVGGAKDSDRLIGLIEENSAAAMQGEHGIRYDGNRREVSTIREWVAPQTRQHRPSAAELVLPWRNDGVYLITGGAGGLGIVLAREIISQVRGARIILVGRSKLPAEMESQLRQMEAHGASVEYQSLDVCDLCILQECIEGILRRHGCLDGVLHGAGVVHDNYIIRKSPAEFGAVLAPKVQGTINLDRATKDIPLTLFVIFSSVSGMFGNAGQSDYAMANAFADEYALYRAELCRIGQRRGRTLSMAWPSWAGGGMQVGAPMLERMRASGLGRLSREEGLESLYQVWCSSETQMGVLKAERKVIEALLGSRVARNAKTDKSDSYPEVDADVVESNVLTRLRNLLGNITSLSPEKIDPDADLESYGLNSVMVMQLNTLLEDPFPTLSQTLFYEYRNLRQVCRYLVDGFPGECVAWTSAHESRESGKERNREAAVGASPTENNTRQAVLDVRRTYIPPHTVPVSQRQGTSRDGIAVIGLAGQYPGARNVTEFWENLKAGRDCIGEGPAERWSSEEFFEPDVERAIAQGKSYTNRGGFIEGFAEFDPLFFGISPREAANMDPQERLFLRTCWEALEDAGYSKAAVRSTYGGKVGVFAGVTKTGFELYGRGLWRAEGINPYTSFSSIANRVSYCLDLSGPSMPIDTMCSASLTAIHEACEHLSKEECHLAFAGGVNLYLHPSSYKQLCAQRMLSKDGKCRSFGAEGNGFVPGEGVGVVLLKRLSEAVRDGDHIYAVIRSTSINHGGKTNGYTVPSPAAQRDVIRSALLRANIDPAAISYIEAHGTGTELGDPIEIAGLTQAFDGADANCGRVARQSCAIGSVKSNIGHLEAAAGIAGVTKVIMQLKHTTLVPSLHSNVLNPRIDFANTPFKVQHSLSEWSAPEASVSGLLVKHSRVAGISAFGAGGANAHIIVQEYISDRLCDVDRSTHFSAKRPALVILSAKTSDGLQQRAQRLLNAIETQKLDDLDLGNLAYTLQVGRDPMGHRLAIAAESITDLSRKLHRYLSAEDSDGVYAGDSGIHRDALTTFGDDDELQTILNRWLEQGKYRKLLLAWVQGLTIEWDKLYCEGRYYCDIRPRRLSLPTYPFATNRYWLEAERDGGGDLPAESESHEALQASVQMLAESSGPRTTVGSVPVGTLTLVPRWEPEVLHSLDRASPAGRVVVCGASDARDQFLRAQCADSRVGAWQTVLTTKDLERTLDQCGSLESIDHLIWIVESDPAFSLMEHSLIERQSANLLTCFSLLKALYKYGYGSRSFNLTVLTRNAALVHANDCINPAQAAVHGLLGSLAKEQPSWTIRIVDLEATTNPSIEEIMSLPLDRVGSAWAYRRGEWCRRCLFPYEAQSVSQTCYRREGVYVLIGGAGALGEVYSEYLIRNFDARIVWIGRKEVDVGIEEKIARLARLGRAPKYICADATDCLALGSALRTIKEHYPRIHGVVHATVSMAGQALSRMLEESFVSVVNGKLATSVCVAQVFGGEPLDFLLFFSSIQTFTTDPRQGNYAAATAFADSFALWLRHQCAVPAKIINWGYWGNTGVFSTATSFHNWMKCAGMGSIDPATAMSALESLLAGPLHQLAFVETIKPDALGGLAAGQKLKQFAANKRNVLSVEDVMSATRRVPLAVESMAGETVDAAQRLIPYLVLMQLKSMKLFGADCSGCMVGQLSSWKSRNGWNGLHDRWLDVTLEMLLECGCVTKRDGWWCVVQNAEFDEERLWKDWEKAKQCCRDNAQLSAIVTVADAALHRLPELLRGKISATDVMFPHSDMGRAEALYNTPVADYFHEVVSEVLLSYVQKRAALDPDTPVRILEVGSGTGSTTAHVLSKLGDWRKHVAEYCYTDVSKAFLFYGQQKFGADNPNLQCRIFNVEKSPAAQGMAFGSYDIVIAGNSLHTTRNIRETLRNVKATLKNHGVLLAIETLPQYSFLGHLAFGLLDGWWRYEDEALRRGGPLIESTVWRRILEEEGFEPVTFPAEAAHGLGEQIIVAQSDGLARQQVTWEQPATVPVQIDVTDPQTPANAHASRQSAKSAEALQGNGAPHSVLVTDQMTKEVLDEHVRAVIKVAVASALKVETVEIDVNAPFADYGLDSILGMQAVEKLNSKLAIDLTSTALFDFSTVSKLARYIVRSYGSAVSATLRTTPIAQDPLSEARVERDGNTAASKQEVANGRCSREGVTETPGALDIGSCTDIAGVPSREPIAIIGLSGRYAKSADAEELWCHLAQGDDLIEAVTRWQFPDTYEASPRGTYCRHGSFLDDIDKFDSLFFNISGTEAKYMDPQQRLFLEESWKALENAGYAGAGIEGSRCGVYAGSSGSDYQQLNTGRTPAQAMWGSSGAILSARISYYLNLHGPAITIDTACSSSLVAIHLACQGLWNRETDVALAGGTFVQCTPTFFLTVNRTGMLASSGRCSTFDDRADGFVPGEGVGVVVLKRLKDAIADGDEVHAVIRGSGINQDGATNGITAPSAESQERLEREVYDTFAIDPEDIQMVEAHGTATRLGDPIEFQALTRAFRRQTGRRHFCAIGSIKTNIGHTTAAAGVAGVIKCVLALKHRKIPPSLHYESGNTHIDFQDTPFYVNTALRDWHVEPGKRRCAAASSFGLSGTNAHIVLEEAPPIEERHVVRPGYVIVLSARTATQLQQQALRLASYCKQHSSAECGNISYTLLVGRKHLRHRLACVVSDIAQLTGVLEEWAKSGNSHEVHSCVLSDESRKQFSLTRYGEQCIRDCREDIGENDYLERLNAIANLFCEGYELDFRALFTGYGYRRIGLPTYPFARESYWIDSETKRAAHKTLELDRILEAYLSDKLEESLAVSAIESIVSA